jgi:hypothetical protein
MSHHALALRADLPAIARPATRTIAPVTDPIPDAATLAGLLAPFVPFVADGPTGASGGVAVPVRAEV